MRLHLLLCLVAAASAARAGWEPLGPFGGPVAMVLVDRGTLLAATSNAQIFRSEDDGESWKPLPFPAQYRATLHSFVVDRQNPGVYFVGLSSDNPEYSGILRTSDSGDTWDRIPEPELRAVWAIAIWQQDSKVMAAGTEDGVFLTRDAGTTWVLVTPADAVELKPVVSLAIDPWESNILYAGTPHLAWKSVDGGSVWQSIHQGMLEDSDVFAILIDDQRRRRVFAATCGGIYRSLDGGAVWRKMIEAEGASFRTYHIAQDPAQPNVLLAGTTQGLVKSEDSGTTWRRVSEHSTHWIAFDTARPNRTYLATDEGLFRSDDGGESLRAINRGFTNRHLTSIAAVETSLYVTALSDRGRLVLRRPDSEFEWEEMTETALQASEPPEYKPLSKIPGLPRSFSEHIGIYDVVRAADGELLAATSRGLARSLDAGVTWKPVPGRLDGTTVSALCRHPTRPEVLFAALFGEIFRSRDHGRSWTPLTAGSEHPNDFVALLVLPGNPGRLIALSRSRGVYAMVLPPEWDD